MACSPSGILGASQKRQLFSLFSFLKGDSDILPLAPLYFTALAWDCMKAQDWGGVARCQPDAA